MSTRRAVFDWTRSVMACADLTGSAKTVAWALAEHAGTNAVAWPRADALAASVGIDERNARKHVVALAKEGFLVVEDRRHLREPSWYWLAFNGETVGDFNAPPKPRSTGRKHPVVAGGDDAAPFASRPDETDRSTEVFRPDGSIPNDRMVPSATTGRIHPVTPIYSPQGTAQGTATRARDASQDEFQGPDPAIRRALIRGYAERYQAATGSAWMSHGKAAADIDTTARWCATEGDPMAAVSSVLDGAFADAWMTTNRWPWGRIAADPARCADGGKATGAERHKADLGKQLQRLAEAAAEARSKGDHDRADELDRQRRVAAFSGTQGGRGADSVSGRAAAGAAAGADGVRGGAVSGPPRLLGFSR